MGTLFKNTISKVTLKSALISLLFVGCLVGAVATIKTSSGATQPTPRESFQSSLILFFMSSASSIIIGYYFARFSTTEKVDSFAERSAEKMINLSKEVIRLSYYLEDSTDVAEGEYNIYATLNAYKHRIDAAARMAQSVAITNVTLGNDWLAVASPEMADTIDQKYATFRDQFEDSQELEQLRLQRTQRSISDATSGLLESNLDDRIAELEQRLRSRESTIPKIPVRQVPERSVSASQSASEASATLQKGELTINVLQEKPVVTGSGKFEPRMARVPNVSVELLNTPDGVLPADVKVRPGTGTDYDFNVTLSRSTPGQLIATGAYVFSYQAACDSESKDGAPEPSMGDSPPEPKNE